MISTPSSLLATAFTDERGAHDEPSPGRKGEDRAIARLMASADTGQEPTALIVAEMLTQIGRVDYAIAILYDRAEAGHEYATWKLVELLTQNGRVDEAIAILHDRAEAGHEYATWKLAGLRASRGFLGSAPFGLGEPDKSSLAGGDASFESEEPAAEALPPSADAEPLPRLRVADRVVASTHAIIFYKGASTTVTSTFFVAGRHRYPMAELKNLERVEHRGPLRPTLYELWAFFRGHWVRLFRTSDAKEFGQVARALARAREYAGLS
jgi:hypothetical protein